MEKTTEWFLDEAARAGWRTARSGAMRFPAWELKAMAPGPCWRAASAREAALGRFLEGWHLLLLFVYLFVVVVAVIVLSY